MMDEGRSALEAALDETRATPGDDATRVRFFGALAAAELFLLLTQEAQGEAISPQVAQTSQGDFVLAFETEEALAAFAGPGAPYAGLSGRTLAAMLRGQGLGLALNPSDPAEGYLMAPDAVDWLAGLSAQGPAEVEAQIAGLAPPVGLPDVLLSALDTRLAAAGGLASAAYLAAVTYADGTRSHLLAMVGALPETQGALARTVQEALVFSGLEAGALDVLFLAAGDPLMEGLARHGLRFDLPSPQEPANTPRPAPGSNPDAPPILR